MSDTERLAEIEATRKRILSEYEFSRSDDDMLMLLTSGIPQLLTALAARVARDAKVVEAARAYRAAERKVEAAGYASMSIGDRLIRGDLRERLDAALADAEG